MTLINFYVIIILKSKGGVAMNRLCKWACGSEKRRLLLRTGGYFACALAVFSFCFMLVRALTSAPITALMILIILGPPFVLVSLVRRLINAPRPYESEDFSGPAPKKKNGSSFPSRHAFSIFAIGTLCLFFSLPLGIITLAFGVLLCFCRVALGIHFVRDVLCGGIAGIVTSIIGALILL